MVYAFAVATPRHHHVFLTTFGAAVALACPLQSMEWLFLPKMDPNWLVQIFLELGDNREYSLGGGWSTIDDICLEDMFLTGLRFVKRAAPGASTVAVLFSGGGSATYESNNKKSVTNSNTVWSRGFAQPPLSLGDAPSVPDNRTENGSHVGIRMRNCSYTMEAVKWRHHTPCAPPLQ